MGVDFWILKKLNKYECEDGWVCMSEEVQAFLYKNRQKSPQDITVLLRIDPYGQDILNKNKIKKIYDLSECVLKSNIISSNSLNEHEQEAYLFFVEIKEFMKRALEEEKIVMALGD